MMKRITGLLHAIGFLAIGFLLFLIVQAVLTQKVDTDQYIDVDLARELYQLEDNEVDVLFLGASHVYHGISPLKIYEDTGIRSAVLGSAEQKMPISFVFLQNALERQHPAAVVLDVSALLNEGTFSENAWERARLEVNDLRTLFALGRIYAEKDGDAGPEEALQRFEYFVLPIYRYHDRWQHLNENDFNLHSDRVLFSKGYCMNNVIKPSSITLVRMNWLADNMTREPSGESASWGDLLPAGTAEIDETLLSSEINPLELYWLNRIIGLCREKGIRLQLIKVPTIDNPIAYSSAWTLRKSTAMRELADALDIPFLDLLYDVDLGIDWTQDTLDGGKHLNIRGAEKVSAYLGRYLCETCGLTAVGDPTYDRDLACYRRIRNVAGLQMEKDFSKLTDWLLASERDLTVLFSVCEDMSHGLTAELIAELRRFGLQTDFASLSYSDTYLAVWEHSVGGDRVAYEAFSDRQIEYAGILRDGRAYHLMSRGGLQGANVDISIEDDIFAAPTLGLHYVVYDDDAGLTLDSGYLALGSGGDGRLYHGDIWSYFKAWQRYCTG